MREHALSGLPLTLAGQLGESFRNSHGNARRPCKWNVDLTRGEAAAAGRAMVRDGCATRAEWLRKLILQAS